MKILVRTTVAVCLLAVLWAVSWVVMSPAGTGQEAHSVSEEVTSDSTTESRNDSDVMLHIDDDDADEWKDLHQQVADGHLVGLPQILDWLEAHYEGQVLEVELERDDGEITYEVEMVGPNGQIVEFEFDAVSGDLIGIEGVGIREMQKTPSEANQ